HFGAHRGAAVKRFPAYQHQQGKKNKSPHDWKLTSATASYNLTGCDCGNQAPPDKGSVR
ncbi:hypothetical protein A2U01_0101493, partial [Trifolium medium]|nr:hypothetical protein [Trifolium medium]